MLSAKTKCLNEVFEMNLENQYMGLFKPCVCAMSCGHGDLLNRVEAIRILFVYALQW